jgi:hypothetical protein
LVEGLPESDRKDFDHHAPRSSDDVVAELVDEDEETETQEGEDEVGE